MEPLQEKDKNSEHSTSKNEIDIEREDIQEEKRTEEASHRAFKFHCVKLTVLSRLLSAEFRENVGNGVS